MKTPRDLLLSRHAQAQARLDALRREIVAEHVGPSVETEPPALAGGLVQLWNELFRTSRRTWIALAAAWLIILTLNLANDYHPPPTPESGSGKHSAARLRIALSEQAQLRSELLQNQGPPAAQTPSRPTAPGPRSERRPFSRPTTA
jgi:hypothetical protein